MSSDTKARKERAKRLQEEIDKLTHQPPALPKPALEADTQPMPPAESPREFIHRRMHELDEAEKKKHKPKAKG
ncbi:MAG: hypothetical protein GC179_12700 [Anaerolineaceae bacterium]|nr:hypothetical protein [Anaerolineaceae bacterium]